MCRPRRTDAACSFWTRTARRRPIKHSHTFDGLCLLRFQVTPVWRGQIKGVGGTCQERGRLLTRHVLYVDKRCGYNVLTTGSSGDIEFSAAGCSAKSRIRQTTCRTNRQDLSTCWMICPAARMYFPGWCQETCGTRYEQTHCRYRKKVTCRAKRRFPSRTSQGVIRFLPG